MTAQHIKGTPPPPAPGRASRLHLDARAGPQRCAAEIFTDAAARFQAARGESEGRGWWGGGDVMDSADVFIQGLRTHAPPHPPPASVMRRGASVLPEPRVFPPTPPPPNPPAELVLFCAVLLRSRAAELRAAAHPHVCAAAARRAASAGSVLSPSCPLGGSGPPRPPPSPSAASSVTRSFWRLVELQTFCTLSFFILHFLLRPSEKKH